MSIELVSRHTDLYKRQYKPPIHKPSHSLEHAWWHLQQHLMANQSEPRSPLHALLTYSGGSINICLVVHSTFLSTWIIIFISRRNKISSSTPPTSQTNYRIFSNHIVSIEKMDKSNSTWLLKFGLGGFWPQILSLYNCWICSHKTTWTMNKDRCSTMWCY